MRYRFIIQYLLQPLLLLILLIPKGYAGEKLSPINFGLNEAKSGTEKYWTIYRTHVAAKESGAMVDYEGIESLDLEIPIDAKPIPLTKETDFCRLKLNVINYSKDLFLFEMSNPEETIEIKKKDIDKGIFSNYHELCDKRCLLFLKDNNLWVKNRRGYKYGHTRRDLLLINKGKSKNKSISDYDNEETDVSASYCIVTPVKKVIKDLVMNRDERSTKRTCFLRLRNQYNVELYDIEIHTPSDTLVNDNNIFLENCCRIKFNNVWIDGSYSQSNRYGYGITMNNVYDVVFNKLRGNGNWGIFGNNNVNQATLINCDLNRFDVHCYGKDITFRKCKFRYLYNQFSSIKGRIIFDKCEFFQFIPVLFETSYNAYTKFDLTFKNCVIHADKSKNYLISSAVLSGENSNARTELRKREYPTLRIDGLTIKMNDNTSRYFIYESSRKMAPSSQKSIPGLVKIKRFSFFSNKE